MSIFWLFCLIFLASGNCDSFSMTSTFYTAPEVLTIDNGCNIFHESLCSTMTTDPTNPTAVMYGFTSGFYTLPRKSNTTMNCSCVWEPNFINATYDQLDTTETLFSITACDIDSTTVQLRIPPAAEYYGNGTRQYLAGYEIFIQAYYQIDGQISIQFWTTFMDNATITYYWVDSPPTEFFQVITVAGAQQTQVAWVTIFLVLLIQLYLLDR